MAHNTGITGCSEDNYVKHMVLAAHDMGMRVVALNNRGRAAGVPLRTPKTYCASFTVDIRATIAHVRVSDTF